MYVCIYIYREKVIPECCPISFWRVRSFRRAMREALLSSQAYTRNQTAPPPLRGPKPPALVLQTAEAAAGVKPLAYFSYYATSA